MELLLLLYLFNFLESLTPAEVIFKYFNYSDYLIPANDNKCLLYANEEGTCYKCTIYITDYGAIVPYAISKGKCQRQEISLQEENLFIKDNCLKYYYNYASGTSQCYVCKKGFYLKFGDCAECPKNCRICISKSICIEYIPQTTYIEELETTNKEEIRTTFIEEHETTNKEEIRTTFIEEHEATNKEEIKTTIVEKESIKDNKIMIIIITSIVSAVLVLIVVIFIYIKKKKFKNHVFINEVYNLRTMEPDIKSEEDRKINKITIYKK